MALLQYGFQYMQSGKWEARSGQTRGRKNFYIGLFDSEIEAAKACDMATADKFGVDSNTNFSITDVRACLPLPASLICLAPSLSDYLPAHLSACLPAFYVRLFICLMCLCLCLIVKSWHACSMPQNHSLVWMPLVQVATTQRGTLQEGLLTLTEAVTPVAW